MRTTVIALALAIQGLGCAYGRAATALRCPQEQVRETAYSPGEGDVFFPSPINVLGSFIDAATASGPVKRPSSRYEGCGRAVTCYKYGQCVRETSSARAADGWWSTILTVYTSPNGAALVLDGVAVGMAPIALGDLSPGEHVLEARLAGHRPTKRSVTTVSADDSPEQSRQTVVIALESGP